MPTQMSKLLNTNPIWKKKNNMLFFFLHIGFLLSSLDNWKFTEKLKFVCYLRLPLIWYNRAKKDSNLPRNISGKQLNPQKSLQTHSCLTHQCQLINDNIIDKKGYPTSAQGQSELMMKKNVRNRKNSNFASKRRWDNSLRRYVDE